MDLVDRDLRLKRIFFDDQEKEYIVGSDDCYKEPLRYMPIYRGHDMYTETWEVYPLGEPNGNRISFSYSQEDKDILGLYELRGMFAKKFNCNFGMLLSQTVPSEVFDKYETALGK